MRRFVPGGGGARSSLIVSAGVRSAGWHRLLSGAAERAGRRAALRQAGRHHRSGPALELAFPIGEVADAAGDQRQPIDVGFSAGAAAVAASGNRDITEESLMLTGDENIIDIDLVQWRISNAGQFLFNIRDPEATVKNAAESAMREMIGKHRHPAGAEHRQEGEPGSRDPGDCCSGSSTITSRASPSRRSTSRRCSRPSRWIDAFNDVQRPARTRTPAINEADAYLNDHPAARGEAEQMIQEAEAYKASLVPRPTGEAERFLSVYKAYKQNPDVTRRRIYLETMQGPAGHRQGDHGQGRQRAGALSAAGTSCRAGPRANRGNPDAKRAGGGDTVRCKTRNRWILGIMVA